MSILRSTDTRLTVLGGIVIIAAIGALGAQSFAAASLSTSIAASALLALSLDLAWGYAGILSLGHGLFFGIPAYAAAISLRAGVDSFFLLALISIVVGGLLAFVVAVLMFAGRTELSLIYIVMATLALSYAGEQVFRTWGYVGADTGIAGLVPPKVLGLDTLDPYVYLSICLAVLLVVFLLLVVATRRDWGIALCGIRENENRMEFSGYYTAKAKVQVFTLSGAIAGLAGLLYAFNIRLVSPGMLGVTQSTLIVIWVLAGGLGTLVGPLLGAAVVSYLSDRLSLVLHGWWEVILGLLLILVLVIFPRGLLGLISYRSSRRQHDQSAHSSAESGA